MLIFDFIGKNTVNLKLFLKLNLNLLQRTFWLNGYFSKVVQAIVYTQFHAFSMQRWVNLGKTAYCSTYFNSFTVMVDVFPIQLCKYCSSGMYLEITWLWEMFCSCNILFTLPKKWVQPDLLYTAVLKVYKGIAMTYFIMVLFLALVCIYIKISGHFCPLRAQQGIAIPWRMSSCRGSHAKL